MGFLLIAVLVTINVTIITVAFIMKPDSPTLSYYIAWGWFALLASVNWIASGVIFVGPKSKAKSQTGSAFGMLPSFNIILSIYSIISLVLVLLFYGNLNNSIHLSVQVILLGITVFVSLLMGIAVAGSQASSKSIVQKSDLLESLLVIEKRVSKDDTKDLIKEMRNYVMNVMHHPSKLNQDGLKNIHTKLTVDKNLSDNELKNIFTSLKNL